MFKIVPQILAFLSLLVIIFIFARNLGKIDEISEESLMSQKSSKPNFLKRFFSRIKNAITQAAVFLLEWVVKKSKKLLHLVHFWIIKVKIKKSEEREEDDDEIENEKEQEARDRLLAEEEENLESVIKEDLAIEEDEEKVGKRKAVIRSFLKNKLKSRRKRKISKEDSLENDLSQGPQKETPLILDGEKGEIVQKRHFSEEDIERKAKEGVGQEKEAKLKEFFGFSKKEKSIISDEERKVEEKEEAQGFQETENEEDEIKAEEIRQELEFLENEEKKDSAFNRIWKSVFQKFSLKRKRKEIEEEEIEDDGVEEGNLKVEQAPTVRKIKEESSVDQRVEKKDKIRFYQKNEKPKNLIKEVVSFSGAEEEIDLDDQLGVDKKILEKKIILKIAKDPKNPENYRQLGEFYIKIKNYEDAVSSYQQILRMKPRDIDAKRKLEKIKLLKRLN